MKKHIQTVHEGQKDFKYNSCGKSFTQVGESKQTHPQNSWKIGYALVHFDERPIFFNQKAVDFRLSDELLHYPQIAPFSYFTELCCACASWEFIFQKLIFHKAQTFKKVGLSSGIEVENGIFFGKNKHRFQK